MEKRRSIAAYCLCAAILAGVNLLYGCTWEEECYAAGLACAAGLCLLACAYVREARQVRRLRELRKVAAEGLCEDCPTETAPEQELAEILRVLSARCASLQGELDTVRRESMDYITVWVHQIKNPIAGLRLILKDGSFPEQAEMESELTRIEQYVDMVLGYMRLESGGSDLVLRKTELDRVIRASIRRLAPQFIHRRLRLVYTPTARSIVTDEKWLEFLLEQLLSNSVKYTPSGSVTITVTDSTISITDTGIGIAAEDLPRVFDKGFTGLNGRNDRKSTGLGLYLSRRAADLLGMELTAQSAVGKGTTMTLRFSVRERSFE